MEINHSILCIRHEHPLTQKMKTIGVSSPLWGCCPACWCPIATDRECTSMLLQAGKGLTSQTICIHLHKESIPQASAGDLEHSTTSLRRKRKLEHIFSFVNYSNWFNTIFHRCIIGSNHTSFVVMMQNPDTSVTGPVQGTVHRCTAPGTDLLRFQFFLPPGKRNTDWYEQQH